MKHIISALTAIVGIVALIACSASDCPLESNVTCNYGFYDSDGIAIKNTDTRTVTTLLPGMHTVFTYRKLGYPTVTLTFQDSTYIDNGYSETIEEVRRDTVLLNRFYDASQMSVPMKYYSENDTIIISYSSISNKDTLYINHDSYSFVDLPECGNHRFHTLKSVESTHSGIYSVSIVNPKVNYDRNENIKIYFNGTAQ